MVMIVRDGVSTVLRMLFILEPADSPRGDDYAICFSRWSMDDLILETIVRSFHVAEARSWAQLIVS